MTTQTHAKAAREMLDEAEHGFLVGDNLSASEKLWLAANQAVMAVAKFRGWACASEEEVHKAAMRLTVETGDERFSGGFGVARGFHYNAIYDWMEDFQLSDHSRVREFVEDTLGLLEE